MKKKEDLIFGKVIKEAVKEEAKSADLKAYLKKMRHNSNNAPSLEEMSEIVKEVRTECYTKK